ncbi:MAG: tRNA (5-methylaminomethyl-2-thiouridine)(34)-methyltransferase MnmD [Bacteroidia bacterium]
MQNNNHHEIITTADGSHTLFHEVLNETYHSKNGALQESLLVFIQNGLANYLHKNPIETIHIFEVGFGTGLNALLTLKEAMNRNIKIKYTCLEAFPLGFETINQLNYLNEENDILKTLFNKMHLCNWNEWIEINEHFSIYKMENKLEQITTNNLLQISNPFDLIYFDAFAPDKQPELWTTSIFKTIFDSMNIGSILVTYSAKGDVKRALREAGFIVKRLAGPVGKRHMLCALKEVHFDKLNDQ